MTFDKFKSLSPSIVRGYSCSRKGQDLMYNLHKGISLQGKKARDPHAQPVPSPAPAWWSAWGSGWTPTLHTHPISALPLLPASA